MPRRLPARKYQNPRTMPRPRHHAGYTKVIPALYGRRERARGCYWCAGHPHTKLVDLAIRGITPRSKDATGPSDRQCQSWRSGKVGSYNEKDMFELD